MRTCLLMVLCLAAGSAAGAETMWENLNPGAGGRIENIVLDPNRAGRAFYCSDMEGAYRSDDHGATWDYIGLDLSESHTHCVSVEPGHAGRVYIGTRAGIEISDTGGDHWRAVDDIQDSVQRILVDPHDVNTLYGAPGSTMRWQVDRKKPGQNPVGQRGVYISRDHGETWAYAIYEREPGRRDVFSILADPKQEGVIYVAGLAGIYRSRDSGRTWVRLTLPVGARGCRGADLSPDGRFIYASIETGKGSELYVSTTDAIAWTCLTNNAAPGARPDMTYGAPRLDPRSTAERHHVLIAPYSDRVGLFEVTVQLDDGDVGGADWERVLYYDTRTIRANPFDVGWEWYGIRPLAYQYAPLSWGTRTIWSTGDQTLWAVDTAQADFTQKWEQKYTDFVREIEGVRFYRTRGVQCTFIFDGEALGDYNVQCNGDNAVKESYDDGHSWTVGLRRPRSNAVAILKDCDPPIVLVHISDGYGAASDNGELWAKALEHRSPRDRWIRIGGGDEKRAGLPNRLYNQLIVDSHDPRRVYIGTRRGHTWTIENAEALYYAARDKQPLPAAICISKPGPGPLTVNDKGVGLVCDPDIPNTLYAAGGTDPEPEIGGQIWKGTRMEDRTWDWTVLAERADNDAQIAGTQIAMWKHDATVYLVATRMEPGHHASLDVSTDRGTTWSPLLGFDDVKSLREHAWFRDGRIVFGLSGVVGHDNSVYFAFTNFNSKRSYGMFRAVLKDGQVDRVDDITGNFFFPCPVKSRVIENNGKTWLYSGTWGCGWWRTCVDELPRVK